MQNEGGSDELHLAETAILPVLEPFRRRKGRPQSQGGTLRVQSAQPGVDTDLLSEQLGNPDRPGTWTLLL